MDPATVVVLLASHLIGCGVLMMLIARHMPPRGGLYFWSAGGIVFGLAYLLRLATGLESSPTAAWAIDAAMVLAVMLFVAGLRRFVGWAVPGYAWFVATLSVYLFAHVALVDEFGRAGRFGLLNAALGLLYGAMSTHALLAARRERGSLRLSLIVLASFIGVLGLMSLARAAGLPWLGVDSLFRGWRAQVYYGYASLAAVLLCLNLLWMVFIRLTRQLDQLASSDALTQLLNRNGLDRAVQRHYGTRGAAPLSVMLLDIDHFKRINDQHGHASGDQVLQAVARCLTERLRASDFVARVGGEEFLIGCVGTDEIAARALAERLREGVAGLATRDGETRSLLRITASVGLSSPAADRNQFERAWREADQALYAAKEQGRNQVCWVAAVQGRAA